VAVSSPELEHYGERWRGRTLVTKPESYELWRLKNLKKDESRQRVCDPIIVDRSPVGTYLKGRELLERRQFQCATMDDYTKRLVLCFSEKLGKKKPDDFWSLWRL